MRKQVVTITTCIPEVVYQEYIKASCIQLKWHNMFSPPKQSDGIKQ